MMRHEEFAACLFQDACPSGLHTWNGSDPAQRFAVYRNNVAASLIEALADTFPVTQALVGDAFFRAMARVFVRAQPPQSPLLVFYGERFPDFIQGFQPASSLPYLADLARLEMAYVKAYHAADAAPLALTELAQLLGDESCLARVSFTLHPSVQLVRSRYAVVSLWAAHQDDATSTSARLKTIDSQNAEAALLMRQGLDVAVIPIEQGAAEFIDNLHNHHRFAAAANTATPFNLGDALELLLRCAAITHFTLQE
jgi:hypothetical protein